MVTRVSPAELPGRVKARANRCAGLVTVGITDQQPIGAEDPNPTEIVELDGIADGSIDVDVACAVVFAKYTRG